MIWALLLLALLSCGDDRRKEVTRLVEEWQGRTIRFPEESVFTVQARDTVAMSTRTPAHKVLLYVDSVGCTSCRLQLHEWKKFIAEVDSATGGTVPFLFYLTPKSVKEARYITRRDDFTHPLCVDMENRIDSLNHFPQAEEFHAFLLDDANRVVLIGNPIHNRAVRRLYLKTLTGREEEQSVNTTIEVPVHELDLGTLPLGEEHPCSFSLRNSGAHPLFIHDVQTDCGCTAATFSKEATPPGAETTISVLFTAEEEGPFSKLLTVWLNTEESPLRLRIKGTVKYEE